VVTAQLVIVNEYRGHVLDTPTYWLDQLEDAAALVLTSASLDGVLW
jgi:hypothetical protein